MSTNPEGVAHSATTSHGILPQVLSRDDTDPPFITARFINNPGTGGLPTPTSVGRWRRDLTPEELEEVLDVAGGCCGGWSTWKAEILQARASDEQRSKSRGVLHCGGKGRLSRPGI